MSDLIGMGDPIDRPLPGIVCLNCGRHWPSPEAVWADADGESPAVPDPSTQDVTTQDDTMQDVATLDPAMPDDSR
jgi:hypothetical protein